MKYMKMLIIMFICLRHGINPFLPANICIDKIKEKCTKREKLFFINLHEDILIREYIRKRMFKK